MRIYQPNVNLLNTQDIKPGSVLIAQGFWNIDELKRSVVLVLEHNDQGTIGVLINKLSNLKVNEALPGFVVYDTLYYGGPVNTNNIVFLHQNKHIEDSVKIADDLFWGGNIYQVRNLLNNDELTSSDIKFYAGLIEWAPGELYNEVNNKYWWVDKFNFDDLTNIDANDLWSYKLIKKQNLYGLLNEIPDPSLS
jgi:putative transcriptional regulator